MFKKIFNLILGNKNKYTLNDIFTDYGVKTLDELRKIQLPKKVESVKSLIANNLNTNDITEIALLVGETYSIERDEELRREIKNMDFKATESSNFDLNKDLLMIYQITTTKNKTFIATIVEPYDPYFQSNLLWFYESPVKFKISNVNDNNILYKKI